MIFFIYVYREKLIGDFAEHKQGRAIYVGCTDNPKRRRTEHEGNHRNDYLTSFQCELKRLGKHGFTFEIVEAFVANEAMALDLCFIRENHWMELLGTRINGFNKHPAGRRYKGKLPSVRMAEQAARTNTHIAEQIRERLALEADGRKYRVEMAKTNVPSINSDGL